MRRLSVSRSDRLSSRSRSVSIGLSSIPRCRGVAHNASQRFNYCLNSDRLRYFFALMSRVEIWRGNAGALRFQIPLIKPDVQLSCIRLSDRALAVRPHQGGSHLPAFAAAYRSFMIRNAHSGLLDIRVPRDRGSISSNLLISLLTLNQGPFAPRSLLASWLLRTSPSPQPAGPVPRGRPVAVLLRADLGFPC